MTPERLRGALHLLHDTVEGTAGLVERTQAASLARVTRALEALTPAGPAARAVQAVNGAIAGLVFASLRGVTRGLRRAGDLALDALPAQAAPPAERSSAAALLDRTEAALNGFWGDRLHARGSGLAIGLGLRDRGQPLAPEREALSRAFPGATGRLCLFVHGLACTELDWAAPVRAGEPPQPDFGARLRADLGMTPLYLRYNTGLHVSENGRQLAALLDQLVHQWPVPVTSLSLVGHSMGGLVVRSAAHQGQAAGARFVGVLRHVVCLGTPHLGAPLEKAVHLASALLQRVPAAGAQVPAELLGTRSAGVKDLRYGYTLEEEWLGRDPDALLEDHRRDVPLVETATYCFAAACLTRDPDHPLGRLVGDALVRVPSAAGQEGSTRHVPFALGKVVGGAHHLALQHHPEVYEALRGWLDPAGQAAVPTPAHQGAGG